MGNVLGRLSQRTPAWALFSFGLTGKMLGHVLSRKTPAPRFTVLHAAVAMVDAISGREGAGRHRRVFGTLLGDMMGAAIAWRVLLLLRAIGVPGTEPQPVQDAALAAHSEAQAQAQAQTQAPERSEKEAVAQT